MKKHILIIFCFFALAQDNQPYPPLDLVSMPTAGTLPKGVFSLETLLMKDGGVLPKMLFGISDRFTFGVSFGIQQFIGVGDISKNKSAPEVQMKYRLYDETDIRPAIVLGLNTQGKGKYFDRSGFERYEQKALGVYLMASRNWNALGNLGFHFGINKNTFENSDRDEDINLFFGIDKEINDSFSLLMEYNFARDDDEISHDNCSENCIDIERLGKGYLNAGLRWSATENLMLEINVNDILKNSIYNYEEDDEFDSMNREVKVIYYEYF
ncbi:MAG: hypothetical protein CMG46_01345 [Candidatus Marinimicrobia bacterium]|nr:hypothetical protein [Candidatus Neomarinimicrobiota bacterium]